MMIMLELDELDCLLTSYCVGVDLVVHTAGPFQQSENCTVLEAAIQNKVRQR